jgi:hypothetical protein
MNKNLFSIIVFLIVSFSIFTGCSKTDDKKRTDQEILFKTEELKADSALATPEAEKLNQLVKENRLDEIFDNASYCFKATYTREKFISEINSAVNELKNIDPNLNIWRFERLDSIPPYVSNLIKGYGVGESNQNPKYVYQKDHEPSFAYIMSYWQNEGGKMKFCGFKILKSNDQSFYGTSSCAVTHESSTKDENFEYIEKNVVIDMHDAYTIKQTIPIEKPKGFWFN